MDHKVIEEIKAELEKQRSSIERQLADHGAVVIREEGPHGPTARSGDRGHASRS
jgi:hypothetical protein